MIENNTVSITASGVGNYTTLGLISAQPDNSDVVIEGNIVRNNKYTLDQSGVTATEANENFTGAIFTALPQVDKGSITLTNNIFHNNEATYTGNEAFPEGTNVALFNDRVFSTNNDPLTYKHNLIANNKSINCKAGVLYLKRSNVNVITVQNNAIWNNQNDGAPSTSITAGTFKLNVGSDVSNNISDTGHVGGTWFSDLATYENNLTDLNTLNIAAKAPYFTAPSTVIGYSINTSATLSNWKPTDGGSYFHAAGVNAGVVTDRSGNPFNALPAVGPYQSVGPVLSVNKHDVKSTLKITKNGFTVTEKAFVRVISLNGKTLKTINVRAGQFVPINKKGVCIIQITTPTISFTVKAIF